MFAALLRRCALSSYLFWLEPRHCTINDLHSSTITRLRQVVPHQAIREDLCLAALLEEPGRIDLGGGEESRNAAEYAVCTPRPTHCTMFGA